MVYSYQNFYSDAEILDKRDKFVCYQDIEPKHKS